MAEAQSRNAISGSVDCFLQSLVSIVNDESASIPITLSVGGLFISGDMIGGKTYFDEFARQFKDGFKNINSETASTIEEAFKRLGDVYDPIQKESQGGRYHTEASPNSYQRRENIPIWRQSGAFRKRGFVARTTRSRGRILTG
jgi:hypothetical protein